LKDRVMDVYMRARLRFNKEIFFTSVEIIVY